jgi:hypothetical protein
VGQQHPSGVIVSGQDRGHPLRRHARKPAQHGGLVGEHRGYLLEPRHPGRASATYDFDNQALRPPARPVAVRPGDVLRVTCTHDVGLRKLLAACATCHPGTSCGATVASDEMCLDLVVWSVGV